MADQQPDADSTPSPRRHDDTMRLSTVTHHHAGDRDDIDINEEQQHSMQPQPPTQPELTMKEKLVLRERQRRIETERARLKQQFVLRNQHGEEQVDDDNEQADNATNDNDNETLRIRGNGANSVAGTQGDESVNAEDTRLSNEDQDRLNFNMERFLRQQDSAHQATVASINDNTDVAPNESAQQPSGLVMERFLNELLMISHKQPISFLNRGNNDSLANAQYSMTASGLNNDSSNVPLNNIADHDNIAGLHTAQASQQQAQSNTNLQDAYDNQDHIDISEIDDSDEEKVAAVDTNHQSFTSGHNEEADRLSFNMERFLRQSGSFDPQRATPDEVRELAEISNALQSGSLPASSAQHGPLLKRFLNELLLGNYRHPTSTYTGRNSLTSGISNQAGNETATNIDNSNFQQDDNVASTNYNNASSPKSSKNDNEGTDRTVSFNVEREPSTHVSHDIPRGPPSLGDASLDANASVQAESEGESEEPGELDTFAPPVEAHGSIDISLDVNPSIRVGSDIGRDDPVVSVASVPSVEAQGSMDISESDTEPNLEEPRVLRLTQADMEEMAAIEEASIGNAPPSEREEDDILSEVGELMDFGGSGMHNELGTMSQGTPTTAMESASIGSGTQSMPPASIVSANAEANETRIRDRSTSPFHHSQSDSSSASGEDTVRVHPPSERANDDVDIIVPMSDIDDQEDNSQNLHDHISAEVEQNLVSEPPSDILEPVEGVVNRQLRPGMVNVSARSRSDSPPVATAGPPVVVEGFDFDKHEEDGEVKIPSTTNSYDELPGDDTWPDPGPMEGRYSFNNGTNNSRPHRNYGALGAFQRHHSDSTNSHDIHAAEGEKAPLLDVPPEIITLQRDSAEMNHGHPIGIARPKRDSHKRATSMVSVKSAVDSIFSHIIEEEKLDNPDITNDSEKYRSSSVIARAFPERFFALTVTLIFEIPVLLMISGGSDNLCALLGRRRYQLLVGFLPLTSAISGNVGLQASTLTTRAVSHEHVQSDAFLPWLLAEVTVATYLGIAMGAMLGTLAFIAGGMDAPFGVTIFISQFLSVVTAGFTGTLAPLIFSFIFRQDSGKWGGPLETAIQDIVGSFAMVIVSYHVLLFFGAGDIDPSDYCGEFPGQR